MKTFLKFAFVALACLAAIPALAAEKVKVDKLVVKTLPAQVYGQLQKGKDLSLVWKGPDFEGGRTFKIGGISWKAPERLGEVLPYLKAQLPEVASANGFYTLDLVVTDAKPSKTSWLGHTTHGFYVMEGAVKDQSGKLVAAFVTKEETSAVGFDETAKPGLDKTISGIVGELFK